MTVKHIRRAVAILKANGAENIGVRCGRHYHVDFFLKGKAGRMIISCSPRCAEMIPKIIMYEIRKLKEGKLNHGI